MLEATAAFGDDAPLMMALTDGVVRDGARQFQNFAADTPARLLQNLWPTHQSGCFRLDTGDGNAADPEPLADSREMTAWLI